MTEDNVAENVATNATAIFLLRKDAHAAGPGASNRPAAPKHATGARPKRPSPSNLAPTVGDTRPATERGQLPASIAVTCHRYRKRPATTSRLRRRPCLQRCPGLTLACRSRGTSDAAPKNYVFRLYWCICATVRCG